VAKVKVNAREIQVEGQLEGDVICDGKLVLAETAVVKGTVRTAVLVMLEGSVLNGSVTTGDSADSPPSRARARRSERETPSRDTDSVPQPTFALSRLAEPDEADV
jgi:cytoskeletal protein CcmA (bactofilin family)